MGTFTLEKELKVQRYDPYFILFFDLFLVFDLLVVHLQQRRVDCGRQ